jgi:hypothetical protein
MPSGLTERHGPTALIDLHAVHPERVLARDCDIAETSSVTTAIRDKQARSKISWKS